MHFRVACSVLSLLFGLVAFSGCGSSRGEFKSYVDGSTKEASLSIVVHDANCITNEPRYDILLLFKDSPKTPIQLGFISDGEFKVVDSDTVQLVTTSDDGLTVKCEDERLRKRIEKVALQFSVLREIIRNETVSEEKPFVATITMFDKDNKPVAQFKEKVITNPEIYTWIASQAKRSR